MTSKVLMMDVDGVLVSGRPTDGRYLFAELEADLGLSPDRLRETFFTPFWEAIITGREGLTERLAPVLAEIAPKVSAERLIAYWFENDSRVDQNVLSAVKRYRKRGVSVFLATNQEHMRADYLMHKVGLGAHVDGIIYSAALGHRKPAAEFFERATAIAGAAPADIVLVDDTLANVEAARRSGWSAVHWTGERRLDDELSPYLG